MKTAVFDHYGKADVVRIEQREMPVPGQGQWLVRVVASTVNSADWR